jgi:beta-glucosidase
LLRDLASASIDDVSVRGYLYWSLMGDYEWLAGFRGYRGVRPASGATRCRSVRLGVDVLGSVARANGIA